MDRKVAIKRLYYLGEYRNIEFFDELQEVPEIVAVNPEAMEELKFLMLLEIELAFARYKQLGTKLKSIEGLEEQVEYLRAERTQSYKQFISKLEENKNK